jgi:hypothetical protein
MSDRTYRLLVAPEQSDWQLKINAHTVWIPQKGEEPSAFYRLMCRLLLGVRWEKRDNG